MTIITPEIKDKVLADLLSTDGPIFEIDYSTSESDYGIDTELVPLIFDEFADLGLIDVKHRIGGNVARITIKAKAMNLSRHGGFTAEEEILKGNIEKLGLELDVLSKQLTPNYAEKASQIAQISSAIMQALTLFH